MRKLLIIFLLLTTTSFAQSPLDSWVGEYSGKMILGHVARANDTIPVEFTMKEIEPDSSWTYKMVFKSVKHGEIVKDYLIKATSIGDHVNFLMDEQNGIIMELSYMNECLYGMYDVLDNTYISVMRKTDDGLFFELFSASAKSTMNTYADPDISEESILVESHKPLLHQSVQLVKNE